MDNLDRPSIKASEVLAIADRYCEHLVTELVELNEKYPHASGLSDGEQRRLASAPRTSGGQLQGPTPESARLRLKSLFCAYMANRFTIEPDS